MSGAGAQPLTAALRLYFPSGSRARPVRFWHRLGAPALAQHLIRAARRAGIAQALLQRVDSGYLPGQRVSHHHPELEDMRHPQCLELLDSEMRLRQFLRDHAEELRQVRVVLFRCETLLQE